MLLLPFFQVLPRQQLPSLTGQLSSSLAPSASEEANAAVMTISEEVATRKRWHYHHVSASVRVAIDKYTSENGNPAIVSMQKFSVDRKFRF